MINTYKDHADIIYPVPELDLIPDPATGPIPAHAAHDQSSQMLATLMDTDDGSSNSSDDSNYDAEGELDLEIESDVFEVIPEPDLPD